jgi:hypothetical protein
MAICERRNDRPAALARSVSGGWRAERSCCLARNAAAWRQGKKIAKKPLRVKVGERSKRIVARDPPAKRPVWTWAQAASQEGIGSTAHHNARDRDTTTAARYRYNSRQLSIRRTRRTELVGGMGTSHGAQRDKTKEAVE